jgi:hypothetical protein
MKSSLVGGGSIRTPLGRVGRDTWLGGVLLLLQTFTNNRLTVSLMDQLVVAKSVDQWRETLEKYQTFGAMKWRWSTVADSIRPETSSVNDRVAYTKAGH